MRSKLLLLIPALGLLAACNPIQIDRAITMRASSSVVKLPADLVMRWRCKTPDGFTFTVNTAAYRNLSAADRAHCTPIPPTHL
jgi:hypothetical protein